MDRTHQTRCTAKRHMAKKLPEVHGNYKISIKIHMEMVVHYKILVDNMIRNQFLIYYQRHKSFLSNFCKCFYQTMMWVIFFTKPFQCIFKQGKGGNSKNETLSFWNRAIYQKAQKEGKLNFIVFDKSTQKDMVADEVGVPNDVLVWLRDDSSQNKPLIKWIFRKNQRIDNHCSLLMYTYLIFISVHFLDNT